MRAVAFAAACLVPAGVTPSPSPSPTPGSSASPSPSPATSVSPTPTVSPTPVATPTILMLPADAPPQILWISLSTTNPKPGDTLDVIVLASSNVASVELRVGGYGTSMPKTDVGRFESNSTVPRLPFFMSHNLTLQVIARNTAGASVEKDVSLQIR
jgi:hypothetical protein